MKQRRMRGLNDKQLAEVLELHQAVLGKLSVYLMATVVGVVILALVVGGLVYRSPL